MVVDLEWTVKPQVHVTHDNLFPRGGTLNVEVIGMLLGNFFEKPLKTPRF